ncbi:COMM domain-containing protein 6 isoform X3 [Scyliorhinus torazame]|uniref:COMM domain-containing protein 6 isoform X3 n=1 Tax=Scyliorhinus torazame TaxID=75743 RepID=UPI003B5B4E61
MAGAQLKLHAGWVGFDNTIESISKLPQDLFAEVCQQIILHLECKTPGVNTLELTELVDLQWKLGMAISSDSCRSLNHPYVTMMLKVADPSGEIISRSFEMTVPQFRNFSKQFREVATALEMV